MTTIRVEPRTRLASLGPKILWAIALAFVLLRFSSLDADPSGLLTSEFFTDEGWYSLNARNQALFGRWVMDEHNVSLVLCPLHTLALWASYAVWGVSFWSTRIVGALASALTVGLIGWRLRKQPLAGALAAALVSTQPILFSLSRVAYCESLQLLFVTAAWFFATDERRRSRSWFLAGAAAALAVFAKASALYAPMLAVAAPFLWTAGGSHSRRLREAGLVVLGGGLVLLAFLPFESRFLELLAAESGRENSALSLIPRGASLSWLIGFTIEGRIRAESSAGLLPLIVLAGLAGSRLILTQACARENEASLRVAIGWIAFSLFLLFIRRSPALPERYWMNLLPPVACLAALACSERVQHERANSGLRSWAACALLAFGPGLVLRNVSELVTPSIDPGSQHPMRNVWIPALIAVGGLTILFRAWRLPQRLAQGSQLATAAAVLVIAWSFTLSAAVVWNPTFSVRDTSRALAADGTAKVLMGNVANTLSLETPFRAFVRRDLAVMELGTGWINGDWRALGATHGLTDGWVGDEREPQPPVDGAALETSYPVWPDASGHPRRVVHLWRLP